MCQNHSHAECEVLGVTTTPPGPARIVRITQPFTMNLLSGEKWTLPPGSIVAVPCSREDALSRLGVQAMGGLFICASLIVEGELTFTHTPERHSTRSYVNGNGADEKVNLGATIGNDDELPF